MPSYMYVCKYFQIEAKTDRYYTLYMEEHNRIYTCLYSMKTSVCFIKTLLNV